MKEIIVQDCTNRKKGELNIPEKFSIAVGRLKGDVFETATGDESEIHFLYLPVKRSCIQNKSEEKTKQSAKKANSTKSKSHKKTNERKKICRRDIFLQDDEFMTFLGEKMEVGKFYFCKALYQGKFVDWGVNVKKIIETPTHQIIFDEDGTKGYNIC